ncbi:MAG TPA: ABC transporter substrate-binding protein [Burkholderiaceae bacterium]
MHRRLFLLLGLSLLLSAPAQAASSHLDRVLAAKVLRACIWPDFYGISYRNPHTQQLTGLDVDMARAFAKDLGVALRFVDTTFATLIDDVTQDRCDIAMFAIGVTPERAGKLRFTRPHLVSDFYAITTRSNRRIKDWSDIDKPGVVVAVIKGTLHEPMLRANLKAARLLVVDSAQARELEVESGRADVFMTTFPSGRRILDQVDWARLIGPPVPYHLTPLAYAVQPGDEPWFARVEQFVATIKRDGRLLESARRHKLETILATP